METKEKVVEPLKEIKVRYTAGSAPNAADLIASPEEARFVFGLGVDGLTPFEFELEGKAAGDRVQYRMARSQVPEMFGHLLHDMGCLPIRNAEFYLNVEIEAVAEVDQRQLVKALAATTSCGDGDCGCGCSGH